MDRQRVMQRIDEIWQSFDGTLALSLVSLDGAVRVERNAEMILKIASTGKLFILGTLLEKCGQLPEKYSLKDTILPEEKDWVGGSGVLKFLGSGTPWTVKDLATMMVIVSDNTATNLLLEYIGGAGEVKKHLQQVGIVDSGVNRRIAMTEEDLNQGCFAQARAKDLTEYLGMIERGEILKPEQLAIYHEIMERQQYKNVFLRYLPLEDFYDEAIPGMMKAGSKTGFDADQRSDAGYIITAEGKTYLYAMIANGGSDTRYTMDNQAELCMAEIGRILCEEVL